MTTLALYTTAFRRTSTKKPALTYAEARAHGRSVKKSALEALNNETSRRQRDARTARIALQRSLHGAVVRQPNPAPLTEVEVRQRRLALLGSRPAGRLQATLRVSL